MPKETFDQFLRREGDKEDAAVLTMNGLVAKNMQMGRTIRGLTQEMLGQRLEAITGRPWSKATVSALERTAEGGRARQFDADDLVAIAMALEVPLLFLFKPRPSEYHPHTTYAVRPAEDDANDQAGMSATDLMLVLLGSSDATAKVGAGDAAALLALTFREVDHEELLNIGDWQQEEVLEWVRSLEQVAGHLKRSMERHAKGTDSE